MITGAITNQNNREASRATFHVACSMHVSASSPSRFLCKVPASGFTL
jgi:hypothetical protein